MDGEEWVRLFLLTNTTTDNTTLHLLEDIIYHADDNTSFARALKKFSGIKSDKFADWFDAFDALEEYLESLDTSRKSGIYRRDALD